MTPPKKFSRTTPNPFGSSPFGKNPFDGSLAQKRASIRKSYIEMLGMLPVPDSRIRMDSVALLIAWQHGFRVGMAETLAAHGVPFLEAQERASVLLEDIVANHQEITEMLDDVQQSILTMQGHRDPRW